MGYKEEFKNAYLALKNVHRKIATDYMLKLTSLVGGNLPKETKKASDEILDIFNNFEEISSFILKKWNMDVEIEKSLRQSGCDIISTSEDFRDVVDSYYDTIGDLESNSSKFIKVVNSILDDMDSSKIKKDKEIYSKIEEYFPIITPRIIDLQMVYLGDIDLFYQQKEEENG